MARIWPPSADRAKARRLHNGLPEAVAVLEGDVADGQPDPDRERRLGPAAVEPVDRLLGGAGRGHAVGNSVEGGHHAVAQALHDRAAIALDGGTEHGVVGAPGLVVPVTEGHRQLGRADDVGEEHRRCPSSHGRPLEPEPGMYRWADAQESAIGSMTCLRWCS